MAPPPHDGVAEGHKGGHDDNQRDGALEAACGCRRERSDRCFEVGNVVNDALRENIHRHLGS
jgi:hypothetical protein